MNLSGPGYLFPESAIQKIIECNDAAVTALEVALQALREGHTEAAKEQVTLALLKLRGSR